MLSICLIILMMEKWLAHRSQIHGAAHKGVFANGLSVNRYLCTYPFTAHIINRLTARILDVSNEFQNKNVPIHERVCVSPPPYYLDWFERSYPNVPLNRDDGPFVFSVWIKFKEKIHLEDNGIDSLMQWPQFLSLRRAQLITLYTSKFLMMAQCPTLQSPLMMFSILLITRTHFLNWQEYLKNTLIWK